MPSPVAVAADLYGQGRIVDARQALGVSSDDIDDATLMAGLTSFLAAFRLIGEGRLVEALPHLNNARTFVDATDDQEAKLLLAISSDYATGAAKLHAGDAHGALEAFERVAVALEPISEIVPELRKMYHSMKAAAFVALARAHLNGSDLPNAESRFAQARDQLVRLEQLLDPAELGDDAGFLEVYGLPLEFASTLAFHDLQVLDVESARERIEQVELHLYGLEQLIQRLPSGLNRDFAVAGATLGAAMRDVIPIVDRVLFSGSVPRAADAELLRDRLRDLRRVREQAMTAGERGLGYVWITTQLSRFMRNLLAVQWEGSDIGRLGGAVSFAAFVALFLVVHFSIGLTAETGALYFSGILILSLIVGFGYSALKFLPLLKLYREVFRASGVADGK